MRIALSALAVSAIMSVTPATATVVDFTNGANGANGTEENFDLTFPDFTIEVRAGVYLLDNIITIDADGIPIGGTTVADLAVSKRDAGLGVVLAG